MLDDFELMQVRLTRRLWEAHARMWETQSTSMLTSDHRKFGDLNHD